MQDKWEYGWRNGRFKNKREEASGRLHDVGYGEKYKRRVVEVLREASVGMGKKLEADVMKLLRNCYLDSSRCG